MDINSNDNNLNDRAEIFSLDTYNTLIDMNVVESDAICVIPRGIKVGIVKDFDLYNLTTGYMSLRLCNTAEPEMRRTTEMERSLVKRAGFSQEINPHKLRDFSKTLE